MGLVYNRPTSSVLPNTCDLLLEKVDKNAEKYNIELVDESLKEDPEKKEPKVESSEPDYPRYYAEKYAATDSVRFFEYLIDSFVISFINWAVTEIFGITSSLSSSLISMLVLFIYYFVMEAFFSRTVGKFILGLKTVELDGSKPSKALLFFRSLFRLVPFDQLSFLLGDGWYRHQYIGHWHDKWSDTYVISVRKEKESQPEQN